MSATTLLACGTDAGESNAAFLALAAPHAERVTRFDRWAHRVASASGAWRSRRALEETAFSQVRSDPAVLAAWIERPGEPALSIPADIAPPTASYRTIHVATIGACEIAATHIAHLGQDTETILVRLDHDGLRTTIALARTP